MVSPYVGIHAFTRDLLLKEHNFSTDEFRVVLTNVEPTIATDEVLADITQVAAGGGYTAGGNVALVSVSHVAGVAKITGVSVVFTGAGGTIGPFQYAVLYNNTNPAKPLISYWDYGAPLTVGDTETFTVVFDAVDGIFTLEEVAP